MAGTFRLRSSDKFVPKLSHGSETFRPSGGEHMDMRRRSLFAAAGAASAAAVLGGAATANAATTTAARSAEPADAVNPNAPLRDLAAAIGLRFGSAIIPQDINT